MHIIMFIFTRVQDTTSNASSKKKPKIPADAKAKKDAEAKAARESEEVTN